MSDPLAQFRKVKVPLWARLLGDWRARREAKKRREEAKKKIVHVATIFSWVWMADSKIYINGVYTLFCNGDDKRWYEYSSHPLLSKSWERGHSHYGAVVLPWLNGAWSDKEMAEFGRKTAKTPERQE